MGTVNHDSLTIIEDRPEVQKLIRDLWADYQFDASHRTSHMMHVYDVPVNSGTMFFFGSCGGKNGWGPADDLRGFYTKLCRSLDMIGGCDYVWVQFGDDPTRIVRTSEA